MRLPKHLDREEPSPEQPWFPSSPAIGVPDSNRTPPLVAEELLPPAPDRRHRRPLAMARRGRLMHPGLLRERA